MNKLIRFGIAGLINTGVDWGVYFLLTRSLEMSHEMARIFALWVGISCAFLLNAYWVFQKEFFIQKQKAHSPKFLTLKKYLHFFGIYGLGMSLNFGIFYALMHLEFQEIICLGVATIASLIFNFTLIKQKVF